METLYHAVTKNHVFGYESIFLVLFSNFCFRLFVSQHWDQTQGLTPAPARQEPHHEGTPQSVLERRLSGYGHLKRPGFGSQQPHCGSQASVTPVLGALMPSSQSLGH